LAGDSLKLYGKDYSYHESCDPKAVVFPQTTSEVIEVVKLCNIHNVPMIPYGAGTSLISQF